MKKNNLMNHKSEILIRTDEKNPLDMPGFGVSIDYDKIPQEAFRDNIFFRLVLTLFSRGNTPNLSHRCFKEEEILRCIDNTMAKLERLKKQIKSSKFQKRANYIRKKYGRGVNNGTN